MDENFFHCCHVYFDDFTNCLIDNATGQEVPTYVKLVADWSSLSNCNELGGWYVSWDTWEQGTEVYALYAQGDPRIQGLLAVYDEADLDAAHIRWAVAAPHNNPSKVGSEGKEYNGVGGHLFAVAAARSLDWGHHGGINGNAANETVLGHYVSDFGAVNLRDPKGRNPYYFVVPNPLGEWLIETYTLNFQ